MKLSLKDINYKDFLINHAEKIIFGLVVVIAAGSLWYTKWDGYKKEPKEFQDKVDQGKIALKQSPWPKENAEKYDKQKDIRKIAEKLIPKESIKKSLMLEELAKIEYSTDFDFPLVQEKEPINEAELFAMESPIVSSGTAVIAMGGKEEDILDKLDNNGMTSADDTKEDDPFGLNRPGGSKPMSGGGDEGRMPAQPEPDMNLGGGGELSKSTKKVLVNKGEGKRFNSIRMIVPLRKFYESYAKAMHKKIPEIQHELLFVDFQIQRKVAIAGADPWAGKWEDVDQQDAVDVLDACAGYNEDSFSFDITEFFTMDLPMRLMGSWNQWASHPRIDHFHLSDEAIEIQKRIEIWKKKNQDKLAEENKDVIEIKVSKLGSRRRQSRSLGNRVDGKARRDMLNDIEQEMNRSRNGRGRKVDRKAIEERLTASGQLLLFRYLDFNVIPGKIYRYRARLELKNPNYNKPIELVMRPSVADKLYRLTPWSESTPPVLVPKDVKYYLANVSTPPKSLDNPTARFDIFQWRAESGTIAHNQVDVKQGEFVSRMTKTYILKPGAPSFLQETVKLGPDEDVLIDVDNSNYVQPVTKKTMLADLKIPEGQKGIGTVDQVLVVDKYGRLISKNPTGDRPNFRTNMKYITDRDFALKDLKEKPESSSGKEMEDGAGGLSDFAGMAED